MVGEKEELTHTTNHIAGRRFGNGMEDIFWYNIKSIIYSCSSSAPLLGKAQFYQNGKQ